MILTTIDCLDRYTYVNPRFPSTFDALRKLAAEPFTKGRKEVDGDQIFINCAEYTTNPPETSSMEFHKRYIDVMWMLDGEEIIGIHPVSALKNIKKEYDAEGDYALADLDPKYTQLVMKKGMVAILFPEDAHAPSMQLNGPCTVHKLIGKVLVD